MPNNALGAIPPSTALRRVKRVTGRRTIVMNATRPACNALVSLTPSRRSQTYRDVPSSERQIDGFWIPHQVRIILLRLSERMLHGSIPSTYRLWRAFSEPQELHFRHELPFLEIDNYPMRTQLREISDILGMTLHGKPVFGDPRSQEVLRRLRDTQDSVEAVVSMATVGAYYIATLSWFHVEKVEAVESEHEKDQYDLTLLNGYVKVLKRAKGIEGVYDLPLPEGALPVTCEQIYIG